jgi:hypothetical protein
MKVVADMTQGELAAYIDTHLRAEGIKVVLSGGACVAIYSNHKYVSKDLDFIGQYSLDRKLISVAMNELGFFEKGKYFSHPQTDFFVEFIAGPPSIGDEPVAEIREVQLATGIVRIISPTDCVKDRLAAYYHWNDRQALEQAVLVACETNVDQDQIKTWSIRENMSEKYKDFASRLKLRLDD